MFSLPGFIKVDSKALLLDYSTQHKEKYLFEQTLHNVKVKYTKICINSYKKIFDNYFQQPLNLGGHNKILQSLQKLNSFFFFLLF